MKQPKQIETIYENALKRIYSAAEKSIIPVEVVDILSRPQRQVEISVPVRKDDDSIQIFRGYRVQHNNVRGPYKGGILYRIRKKHANTLGAFY